MLAMMIITAAVSAAVKWIDNLIHANEKCAQRVDELMSKYKEMKSAADANARATESIIPEYERLSQGVDKLGGNLSLTNDEYERYKEIVNQIADMFPKLITGYDSEGNAIIALKGNVEELRNAYKSAQLEAANLLIVDGKDYKGNDIMQAYQDLSKDKWTWDWNTLNPFDATDIRDMQEKSVFDKRDLTKEILDITQDMSTAADEYASLISNLDYASSRFLREELKLQVCPITAETLLPMSEEELKSVRKDIEAYYKTIQSEIDLGVLTMKSKANAYLTSYLLTDFSDLDEQSAIIASRIVNSIDEEVANSFNGDENKVSTYVLNTLDALTNNEEAKTALTGLFTNNLEELDPLEAKETVDNYIRTIADALKEKDTHALTIRLGFEDVDKLADNYNTVLKNAAAGFSGEKLPRIKSIKYDYGEEYTSIYNELAAFAREQNIRGQDELALLQKCVDDALSKNKGIEYTIEKYLEYSKQAAIDNNVSFSSESFTKSLDELSKIQSLYNNFFNNGEYGVTIDYSSVAALREALGETCESFDEFEKSITSAGDSAEKQKSFDKLISEYIYASGILTELDSTNVDLIRSQLELKGIYEETEGTLSSLAVVNEELRKSGYDISTITLEEAKSFLASGAATGIARQQFIAYILSKNNINDVKLDTADDIRQFQEIAEAAGVSTYYCDMLAEALSLQNAYDNVSDNDDAKMDILKQLTALKERIKNEIPEVIGDIGSQFKTIIDPSSIAKSASSAADTIKQAFDEEKDYLDYLRKAEIITDTEYYNRLSELNEQYYQNSKDHAKEYRDYALECQQALQKLAVEALESQLRDMDKAVSAVQKKLDKQIKSIEKQKDAINAKYDTEMNALQLQIDALDEQKDELQEVNGAKQTALDLEQKLYELSRAQNQRVNQVFNGEQFVYEADAASMKSAAQAVDEARLKQTISEIEQAQKRLKETKDSLETALNEEIAVLDAEIGKLQEYKEQWSEVSSAYEESQNDLIAAQLLGKNWESDILSARLDTMQDFCDKYIELQNKIAEANKAIAEQGQEKLSSTDVTSSSTIGSSSADSKGSDGSGASSTSNPVTYYYWEDAKGNQVSGLYTSYSEAESKKSLNPGAKSIANKEISKYASGVQNLNRDQLAWTQEQGREIIISPSTGAVLTPLRQGDSVLKNEFTENLFKWAEMEPELLQHSIMDMTKNNIPHRNIINQGNTSIIQNNHFSFPNITNNSGIEYLERELRGLSLAALQYSTRRN